MCMCFWGIKATNPPLDTNECMVNPDICGLGDCTNNADGTFYECNCQAGATTIGTSSDGTLTCVGRCISTSCICMYYISALAATTYMYMLMLATCVHYPFTCMHAHRNHSQLITWVYAYHKHGISNILLDLFWQILFFIRYWWVHSKSWHLWTWRM